MKRWNIALYFKISVINPISFISSSAYQIIGIGILAKSHTFLLIELYIIPYLHEQNIRIHIAHKSNLLTDHLFVEV